MKKYEKMSPIFEFSISQLGYVAIFIEIRENIFDPLLRHFCVIRAINNSRVF